MACAGLVGDNRRLMRNYHGVITVLAHLRIRKVDCFVMQCTPGGFFDELFFGLRLAA